MSVLKVHEGPRGARQTKPKRAGGKLGGAGGGAHSRPETAFDVSASGARPPSAKRALRPHTVQVDPRQLDEYAASLGFELQLRTRLGTVLIAMTAKCLDVGGRDLVFVGGREVDAKLLGLPEAAVAFRKALAQAWRGVAATERVEPPGSGRASHLLNLSGNAGGRHDCHGRSCTESEAETSSQRPHCRGDSGDTPLSVS